MHPRYGTRALMRQFALTWKTYKHDRNSRDLYFADMFLRAAIDMRNQSHAAPFFALNPQVPTDPAPAAN